MPGQSRFQGGHTSSGGRSSSGHAPSASTTAALEAQPRRSSQPTTGSGELAHYQLGDCLGRGAFGSVYRALNWDSGETVAVKQIQLSDIPKSELGEIMSEIDLLKNLNHPNIVKYKGFVKTREFLHIILEYCENGSLQNICKRFGKFPENLVGVYISQVLEGLLYLHDQGVIHRDIKGANILTTKDGSIKLADFGVATRAGVMSDNAVVGSPYWMAPEVIDQSGATTASDIWSVGCVVIELLQGKPPYHYLDPMPALFRIVQDDCPPLPEGASPIVKDFLLHCFQKDANLRVSARKLLRHPWMMAAKRQLEQQMRASSHNAAQSTRDMRDKPRTVYDEAVKSVQEWNEALKEPPKPANARSTDSGTFKLPAKALASAISNANARRPGDPTSSSQTTPRRRRGPRPETVPEETGPLSTSPIGSGRSSPTIPPLGQLLPARNLLDHRGLANLQQPEEQTDNWDDDFEEDITLSKIAALEKATPPEEPERAEEEDATVTIRVGKSPRLGGRRSLDDQAAAPRSPMPTVVEDYSDLVSEEDEGTLGHKVASMRSRQNSMVKRLFHPNDLKTLMSPSDAFRMQGSSQKDRSTTIKLSRHRPSPPSSRSASPASPSPSPSPGGSRNNSLKLMSDEMREVTRRELGKYSELDDDDYSDVFGKTGDLQGETSRSPSLQLTTRLSNRSWLGDEDSDEDDPFAEIDEGFDEEADLETNLARDKFARTCALIAELVDGLRLENDDLKETCEQLIGILTDMPEMKAQVFSSHGALAVVELLEQLAREGSTYWRDVIARLLGILNLLIVDDLSAQENLCLIGGIPVVMQFTSKKYSDETRLEAAHFLYAMCSASSLTLQFVLSCRGLKVLVQMVEEDYAQQKDLVWIAVNCVSSVFELQSPTSRNDFCRMFASEGLLDPLSQALMSVLKDHGDVAESIKPRILQIFQLFSQSDAKAKEAVAKRSIIRCLLKACDMLDPEALVAVLKIIKNLTMSPSILEVLQNCNTIEILVHILAEYGEGTYGTETSNQVLNAIYNLCRINKSRQEEAATAGVIPHLLRVVESNSPLKQFALPVLCDLAHAGKTTRKLLWKHDGLPFYLRLLADPYWQVSALESILVWLQDETARVEDVLQQTASIDSLVRCFTSAKATSFENLLEPFLKILRMSTAITLGISRGAQFFRRLIDRLDHGKAVVRLNLLRILKTVCDVHPDRQAVVERYGLFEIIDKLSKQDGAVLVRELARDILSQRYFQPATHRREARRTASESYINVASEDLSLGSSTRRSLPRRPQLLG